MSKIEYLIWQCDTSLLVSMVKECCSKGHKYRYRIVIGKGDINPPLHALSNLWHVGRCLSVYLVNFVSRVRILTRGIDIANLSVCPFVRPLRSGILWKRLNIFITMQWHAHGSPIVLPCSKKTSPLMFDNNFGKFSKFFHHVIRKKILYVHITKISTSPAICCIAD